MLCAHLVRLRHNAKPNTRQPALNSIMDDVPAAQASVERLKSLEVRTVYPGHGQPFLWGQYSRP